MTYHDVSLSVTIRVLSLADKEMSVLNMIKKIVCVKVFFILCYSIYSFFSLVLYRMCGKEHDV